MSNIRARIAPSPTGPLHIGTARTALFNYLFAKKRGGVFVLRIEDTDLERSNPKYEQDIFDSLRWLGISYDEGPGVGGAFGPYRQSERLDTYEKHLKKLLDNGSAFYCFHTEAELETERERLLTEKKPPIHVCEYRDVSLGGAAKLLKEKTEHIIRFRTQTGKRIIFDDLLRDQIAFDADLLGDFSLAKGLRVPLYNFAVVVDDFEMNISHVIRGEDHISNTPKQILIQEALGMPRPAYAHLPLILGPDRSKLSKRHGAAAISDYREAGYLPEALVNFMALLGWNPGTDQEIFSLDELVREFDFAKVQKSGAVFNVEKLDWLNGHYIRQKPLAELTELCLPFLERAGLAEIQNSPKQNEFATGQAKFKIQNYNAKSKSDKEYLEAIIVLEQPRLKKLSEIRERADYFFREPSYGKELLRWKNMSDKEVSLSLGKSITLLQSPLLKSRFNKGMIGKVFLEEIGAGDKGVLLWPLRAALTGKEASPGPFEVMEILGIEETKKRLMAAKEKLE